MVPLFCWALLLDNNSLDAGDCFSVQSIVRKEADSGAPVQEDNSIGSSITPINWRSGFQMAVVLVRIMTTITEIPQRQEKPLMQFQTVLTLKFTGSTPA